MKQTLISKQRYLSKDQKMKKVTIQAEYVIIQCFIGPKQHLFDQLCKLKSCFSFEKMQTPKKIVFLIQNLKLSEYSSVYDQLKAQFALLFKQFYINILMVNTNKDVQQHLSHIRKVNEPIFEQNYLHLQHQCDNAIDQDIVQNYLLAKLKWNSIKSKYFIQKNKIASIKDLIQYQSFPFYQKGIINKTVSFMQFCKSQLAKKLQSS